MTIANIDAAAVGQALGRFSAWVETMRVGGGYGGPAIGLRGAALTYCGPGFDWRYEGLLDGARAAYFASKGNAWLDRIVRDLSDVAAAQLLDGSFKNSYFEFNPCEGGMPHEPAMMAAACRAMRFLQEAGRPAPIEALEAATRYVDEYLIKQLWNKSLLTFNDWPISQFQYWTPHACASAIELLAEFSALTGEGERYARYIQGAADSILAVQFQEGPLAGGVPPSSRDKVVSPFLAARCLPGLVTAATQLNEAKYRDAAQRLAEFVRRQFMSPTALPRLVYADRPAALYPQLAGALAGTVHALRRAGFGDDAALPEQVRFFLAAQLPTGAFESARGFGANKSPNGARDWRDVMPVVGWQDKIFALLAELGATPSTTARNEPFEQDVVACGRRARYREDAQGIHVEDRKGGALFIWEKGSVWPQECLL